MLQRSYCRRFVFQACTHNVKAFAWILWTQTFSYALGNFQASCNFFFGEHKYLVSLLLCSPGLSLNLWLGLVWISEHQYLSWILHFSEFVKVRYWCSCLCRYVIHKDWSYLSNMQIFKTVFCRLFIWMLLAFSLVLPPLAQFAVWLWFPPRLLRVSSFRSCSVLLDKDIFCLREYGSFSETMSQVGDLILIVFWWILKTEKSIFLNKGIHEHNPATLQSALN